MQAVEELHSHTPLTSTNPRVLVSATLHGPGHQAESFDLRRAVTLIGSKRHAHIVLRDDQVSRSHALIVNTGAEVLLADLLSKAGTLCNGHHTKLKVLKDGDRIQVGASEIVLAIEKPHGSPTIRRGMMAFHDPLRIPRPMRLVRVDTAQGWDIHDSVTVIGSHRGAQIIVDEEHIASAHSIIFATLYGIGIYDLGSTTALKVNGREKKIAYLRHLDRLLIGPIGMTVQMPQQQSAEPAGRSPDAAKADEVEAPQQDFANSWEQIHQAKKKLAIEQDTLTARTQALLDKQEQLDVLGHELQEQRRSLNNERESIEKQRREVATLHRSMLQSKRLELEGLQAAIQEERLCLEADRRSVQRLFEDVEKRSRQLAEREDKIAAEEARIFNRRESLGHSVGTPNNDETNNVTP